MSMPERSVAAAPEECEELERDESHERMPESRLRETVTSLKALHDEHFRAVRRTARRFGIPDARIDDVCQEVFLVAYRKLPEFDGLSPKAWLLSIVRRVASDFRRAEARERRRITSLIEFFGFRSSSEPFARLEGSELVLQLLDELSEEHRKLIVLCVLEEMPLSEVAHLLQLNINTATSRLRVARSELRRAYERHTKAAEKR